MGRWRPPTKSGSPYITAAGYAALQEEQKSLWARRRDVVKALAAAAAEGDRSENAEYIYRKKELAGIDRRVRYLQRRMPTLKIVRHAKAPEGVFFGAHVTVCNSDGETRHYQIVGEDEAKPGEGRINVDSPMAKALLKRQCGEQVSFPGGRDSRTVETKTAEPKIVQATITDIRYDLD